MQVVSKCCCQIGEMEDTCGSIRMHLRNAMFPLKKKMLEIPRLASGGVGWGPLSALSLSL